MRDHGLTVLELLVVMAIMGILMAIAVPNWNNLQKKSAIENEVKTMSVDLTALRLDALYAKRPRSVVLSATQFSVYSSSLTSVSPVSSKTLHFPLRWQPASSTLTLTFDASGLCTAAADTPLCVDPDNNLALANPGAVDSLVISAARIKLGKREQGGACDATGTGIAQK